MADTCLVVTTISSPNASLKALANGAREHGIAFIAIGDLKTPAEFDLCGCRFYDLEAQKQLSFSFAKICPVGHYARKNVGYLLALAKGAEVVLETDDDNFPLSAFWAERDRSCHARLASAKGWTNVYGYFSDSHIWPRGFALEHVKAEPPPLPTQLSRVDAPIQQGLVAGEPDVDAIYRMVVPAPVELHDAPPVALGRGVWCPFNSQNTAWWREAAALLYLPSTCSMRMTDIWRSFIAQRIAWENGWSIVFQGPTARQQRNPHDLLLDFRDEILGYLHSGEVARILEVTELTAGVDYIAANMRACYRALAERGIVENAELRLLDAWLSDVAEIIR